MIGANQNNVRQVERALCNAIAPVLMAKTEATADEVLMGLVAAVTECVPKSATLWFLANLCLALEARNQRDPGQVAPGRNGSGEAAGDGE